MYALTVSRDFTAHHYLFGGDWGAENRSHPHDYKVEVELQGKELDEHGYLVDIVRVDLVTDRLVERFRDRLLNDLPEFKGLNPSIERFARIFLGAFLTALGRHSLSGLRVTVWENRVARASYEESFR